MAVLNGNPTAIGGDDGRYVETLRSTGWTQLESHIMFDLYNLTKYKNFQEILDMVAVQQSAIT